MPRMMPLLVLCLFLALQTLEAAGQETGGVWRVQEVVLGADAAMNEEQAAAWLDKRVRISQTAISFEGRTCRVTPDISRVQVGIFLAAQQTTPQELGVEDGLAELVDTGCDIPGFQTLLALPDGRFVSLHKGAFMFLVKDDTPRVPLQEVDIPEAGLRCSIPETVRILAPGDIPEQGLGFWYETAPLHELDDGAYPFNLRQALLDRAALAANDTNETEIAEIAETAASRSDGAGLPVPLAFKASQQPLELPDAMELSWGKRYALLQGETPCSVRFVQAMVLYHAGWVTQLAVTAAPETIINENPGYFDTQQCQQAPHWSQQQGQAAFWSMLQNDRASNLAAAWDQAFATLLQTLELRTPKGLSFLAKDNAPCRSLPADTYAQRFPKAFIVPQHSFRLVVPGNENIQELCLLTLTNAEGEHQVLTAGNRLLQPLEHPGAATATRALGVEDLNSDGLPDIIVVSRAPADDALADPESTRFANRVYFSRRSPDSPAGMRWQFSATYSAAIADEPTVPDAALVIRAMRQELRRSIGQNIQIQGTVEEQFGSMVVMPQNGSEPLRCLLVAPDPLPEVLRSPGQRVAITARILEAEDAWPPLTLRLQILQHSLVQPAVPFDFNFSGNLLPLASL